MHMQGHGPTHLYMRAQVGPLPWLGPQTKDVIEGYARSGRLNLLVVRVGRLGTPTSSCHVGLDHNYTPFSPKM